MADACCGNSRRMTNKPNLVVPHTPHGSSTSSTHREDDIPREAKTVVPAPVHAVSTIDRGIPVAALESRLSYCEVSIKQHLLPLEARLSQYEAIIRNVQETILASREEMTAHREEMAALRKEVADKLADKMAEECTSEEVLRQVSQLRDEHRKELATFGVQIAVSHEMVKNIHDTPPCVGNGEVSIFEMNQRLQAFENASIIERLNDVEISQGKRMKNGQKNVPNGSAEKASPADLNGGDHVFEKMQSTDELQEAIEEKKAWMHENEKYVFEESIWDLSLFVGLPQLGDVSSVWVVMVLGFNILLQVGLCLIIQDAFTIPAVDDDLLNSLRLWRISTPHDFKWFDEFRHMTLANRICGGDAIPPISSSVTTLLGLIDGYQTNNGPRANSPMFGTWFTITSNVGMCMTCMSVIIWWLEVLLEISDTHDLAISAMALPSGTFTDLSRNDGVLKVDKISATRRAYLVFICVSKFCVAALLLGTGTFYLAFTIDIGELLLNAAALSIVFNIDEMMYSSLSPRLAKQLINNLEPLVRPRGLYIYSLDARPLIKMAFLVIGLILLTAVHLNPQNNQLILAREKICGGNVDFVSTVDAYGAILATDVPRSGTEVADTYQYRAMTELVDIPSAAKQRMSTLTYGNLSWSATALGVFGAAYSIESQNSLGVGENLKYWVTECTDMPPESSCQTEKSCWRMKVLQAMNKNIKSCADAERHCGLDSVIGIRARQYCPKTCHCDDPTASNMFFLPRHGCGAVCAETEQYENVIKTRSCADAQKTDPLFIQYLEGVDKALKSYAKSAWYDIASPVFEKMKKGCTPDILAVSGGGYIMNMCSDSNLLNWKPMSFVCPVTCGCLNVSVHSELCPPTCTMQKDISWLKDHLPP